MFQNLEVFLGCNHTTLHFVSDGNSVRRYGSKGFYDVFKAEHYDTRQLFYTDWEAAPASLCSLNNAVSLAEPCNYVNDTTALANFNFMWGVADLQMRQQAKILAINVGADRTYLVYTGCSVKYMREWSFSHSQFASIKAKSVSYPCFPAVPFGLRKLMELTFTLDYYSDDIINEFKKMWYYLTVTEVNTEMPVSKTETPAAVPYKALMLFDDYATANGYDHEVYLYSSAGIKRLTFTEYLHTVEAAHSSNYRLVKCIKSALTGLDTTHYDALRKMDSPKNGNKLGTIYMCFRALWFATTGEAMSTTAWKEEE